MVKPWQLCWTIGPLTFHSQEIIIGCTHLCIVGCHGGGVTSEKTPWPAHEQHLAKNLTPSQMTSMAVNLYPLLPNTLVNAGPVGGLPQYKAYIGVKPFKIVMANAYKIKVSQWYGRATYVHLLCIYKGNCEKSEKKNGYPDTVLSSPSLKSSPLNYLPLTLKSFLGSLKTPEDKNMSYFFNQWGHAH